MSNLIVNNLWRNKKLTKNIFRRAKYSSEPTYIIKKKEDEYDQVPNYPPIESLDEKTQSLKEDKKYYDLIKRQKTIEEKQIAINLPRYWGWKSFVVEEGIVPYNGLDFIRHLTRTHLIETDVLPPYYSQFSEKIDSLTKQVKSNIEDAIAYQLEVTRKEPNQELSPLEQEKEFCRLIVHAINRAIINNLCSDAWHLKETQIDYSPRVEGFWQNKSITETFVRKQPKRGIPLWRLPEEYEDRPSNKYFQYIGHPILQIRHDNPLPAVSDVNEGLIFQYPVSKYDYDPHNLGFEIKRRFGTNIPGFWGGEKKEFSLLSYHSSNYIKHRPPTYGEIDAKEALQWQAISSSFGWLMALANYQGFTCYHDITYPFVNQAILTNGKEFSFSVYQLNTTELYHEDFLQNPKCNLCWITPAQKLYEFFEGGKLTGFNEDVLKNLIAFYVNEPKVLEGVNLKPYLGKNEQIIADYQDDEKVAWLEKMYKKITTQRQIGGEEKYEVYNWERIYIIEHNALPNKRKTRPFELNEHPYLKPMTVYKRRIKRSQRLDTHLPKWKQRKYEVTYWPK